MRVVLADTSPVNYLILIDCIHILRLLYAHIAIPTEVLDELTSTRAPSNVSKWIRNRPDWIEVRTAPVSSCLPQALTAAELDAGEQAAIQLALAEDDALLLIDETKGRFVASQLGIPNTGTLGILLAAAQSGFLDLRTSLNRLRETNFRISQSLIDQLLTLHSEV